MRIVSISLILPIILWTGCAPENSDQICYDSTGFAIEKEQSKPVDFDKIMVEATKATAIKAKLPITQMIMVTDFVKIGTLRNDTKLGFILSNKLKNALVQKGFRVKEAEVSKFFEIGSTGLKLLSRDKSNLLSDEVKLKYALVGTYTATSKRLIIFVKLIDITNGLIVESYTKDIPITPEIIDLVDEKIS